MEFFSTCCRTDEHVSTVEKLKLDSGHGSGVTTDDEAEQ